MNINSLAICGVLTVSGPALLSGEVRTLTLRQAVDLAARQSPGVLMARLELQQAGERVNLARDPFFPKVFAGSGLAYSSGFPMSIEGSAPSIVQARAVASVYDRKKKIELAQAREEQRGAAMEAQGKRDQTLFRTLELYLEAERKLKILEIARRQVESAEKLEAVVNLRVKEGQELPVEATRAAVEVAKARQRVLDLETSLDYASGSLAMVLGLGPGDRVRPAAEERTPPQLPETAEAALRQALEDNREIRRLESSLLAWNLEGKAHQAARYPRLELVAQYGLFARFNNYDQFFQKFQRHNGQLGVSLEIPLLSGPAARAGSSMAEAEAAKLKLQINSARSRITLDVEKSFQDVRKAESARQVSRLELELERQNLSMLLARLEEGRASLQQVEQARGAENEKWMLFYDAQYALDLARFALLGRTGELMAALR